MSGHDGSIGPWRPVEHPPLAQSETPPVDGEGRGRRGLIVALVLVSLAAAGLAAGAVWLGLARAGWESQNGELRDHVAALTDDVSERNARLAELETVEAQLEQLKAEYSDAVNTSARGTEAVAGLEQIVEAYGQCVEAQQEHFDVLRNAELYVPSSIRRAEESIMDFCAQVDESYAAYLAENG